MKLQYKEEVVRVVQYSDLDAFITEVSGHEFECVSNEEWSNGSCYRILATGKASEFAKSVWENQKIGQGLEYSLRYIMDCLVGEGMVEPGNYLIQVSW